EVQRHVGTATKTPPQRTLHFWHNPGGRSGNSNQSGAGPAICAALVFSLRALSRDAAFGRAGSKAVREPPASSHRRIQPPRARVSTLPGGENAGGRGAVAF